MELKIKVRNKIAKGGDKRVVCGNSDYLVRFDLDEEWAKHQAKTMRVEYTDGTYTDVVFSGEVAALPVLRNRERVFVGLYAGNIRTSTPAELKCEKCISDDGGTPAAPEENVYDQLMALLESGKIKGEKGDTGAAFTYEDFTEEQLAALRGEKGDTGSTGPKGEQGAKGDTGAAFTYDMFTPEQLAGLKGEKGEKGDAGERGPKGENGVAGTAGADGTNGHTPVRGTDYWTAEDIAAIQGYVEDAILGGEW